MPRPIADKPVTSLTPREVTTRYAKVHQRAQAVDLEIVRLLGLTLPARQPDLPNGATTDQRHLHELEWGVLFSERIRDAIAALVTRQGDDDDAAA